MEKKLEGIYKQLSAVIAVAIGLFHIVNVSGLISVSDMTIRVLHLTAMIMLIFLRKPKLKGKEPISIHFIIGGAFALTAFASGIYILTRWKDIAMTGGVTTSLDAMVGILTVAVVLLSVKRSTGIMLSVITIVFLIYPFVGKYLPGILQSKSYTVERVFSFLYTTTQGIYGTPISVSATYIILFCIYGAFLSEFGAGQFLFKLSSVLTRKYTATAAKTSIVFSALIGMISGSAAGNVAITGTLTIPMMEKEGYSKEQAGAVSAVAATGGQIMPPIMGAAAFIMAEILGIPYAAIMKAALIPAILYFLSLFIIVHLQAKKSDIKKLNQEDVEPISKILKEGWYFILPIGALIYMLVIGASPFKSVYYSMICLVIVYIIVERKFNLEIIKKILNAIRLGTMDTVSIAAACAASGIIVGVLSITGLGSKLSMFIIALSNGSLIIALILTMVVAIILGMGLPTTAAYLVLATVISPALVNMGMAPLTAHMFVFFFGCVSTITPPVALASYVAAGIANADLNKVGWTAFRYGIVSFILPFMFAFSPSLLLEGDMFLILLTIVLSIIGVFAVSASIVGYFKSDLDYIQRAILFIGGILLINDNIITSAIGIVIIGVILFINIKVSKKIMN